MSKRFARMIQRLRKTKGMSQRALAAKVQVTQGYIAQLEGGSKQNPSLSTLRKLAKALGVPVTELLG